MEHEERTRYRAGEARRPAAAGEPRGEGVTRRVGEMRGKAGEFGDRVKRRTRRAVDARRSNVAGGMERVGHRLRERGRALEPQGGMKSKAGKAVERVGERVERGADYVRTHEVGEMRSDLEVQVRDHPLTSVAVALGAGFLVGRIIR